MTKIPIKQQIANLASILRAEKIRHIIICPGSRNAPLMQVFERDENFSCYSIADERSAGYIALGMARHLREPVVIVTTSGTAALNLGPAVAEAFYQNIPLIVITADRPAEWPPQFENQRINQKEIYLQNSKFFYNLPEETANKKDWTEACFNMRDYIRKSMTEKSPVHLNIPLHEPLYESIPEIADCNLPDEESETEIEPYIQISKNDANLISGNLLNNKKVLLIAGMNAYTTAEREVLKLMSENFNVTVIAENLSNLSGDGYISSPEIVLAAINEEEKKSYVPDLVITFGGQIVSKRTRLFIQGLPHIPTIVLPYPPQKLFNEVLIKKVQSDKSNTYLDFWRTKQESAASLAVDFFKKADFSNVTAVYNILDTLPEETVVHLGNSGTIRYSQLVPARPGLTYFSNRGTSGIDGCVSTATGAAMVSTALHFLIVGDLSFVYDSNALWNSDFPVNLKIIVLNDHGGGIFRLLDGPDKMPFFEKFSVTNHPVSIRLLAEAFGVEHLHADNYGELQSCLKTMLSTGNKPQLLEVDTSGCENSIIFKQFFKSIQYQ